MKNLYFFTLFILCTTLLYAQPSKQSETNKTQIIQDLQELCDGIGGRVTGSEANEKSVEWGLKKFQEAGVKAWKEEVQMPVLWLAKATRASVSGDINFAPSLVSKYQSPPGTYEGDLIFAGMGNTEGFEPVKDKIKGQFVLVETDLCLDVNGLFAEYTAATETENLALKYGAKGIIFMASRPNGLLYRFISSRTTDNDMPQLVMAREDAKRCMRTLSNEKSLKIKVEIDAEVGGKFTTHNVIAEIPGTEKPEEIVIIGAHLDSWALGTGANDNGCNVVMMIDIARRMTELNIKPKRTIRFALWNGEEQGYFGSWAYTQKYASEMENHVMALSVDIGSGPITGFFANGRDDLVRELEKLLMPLVGKNKIMESDFTHLDAIIVGTDNFDFMLQGVPNLVAIHKPANYGTTYHAASDTFDKVDQASLIKNRDIISFLTLAFADDAVKLPRQSRKEIQTMFDAKQMEYTMRMFNVWESWMKGERGRK